MSTVYKNILFQGQSGSLAISEERIVFQQQDADPSAKLRSWQWKSMKKYQVVFSESPDCPDGKCLIKFYNHANKAVSFLVPEMDLLALQGDIDSRMGNGDVTSDATPTKSLVAVKEPSISADKAKDIVSKVQSIKAARQSKRRQTQLPTKATANDTKAMKKDAIKKSKSFDPAVLKVQSKCIDDLSEVDTTQTKKTQKCASKKQPPKRCKSALDEPIPTRTSAKATAKPAKQPVKRSTSESSRPKSPMRTKEPVRRTKTDQQTSKGALELAQDLIIKPGQQVVKDYVVNPANNLIVVPANRNIVKPAKETAEMLRPAAQKILEPTKQVAQKVLLPTKVIAEDMGLIKRQSSAGESAPATTKKPFLHFLKTPERRVFDEDEDIVLPPTPSQRKSANLVATSSA